MRLQLPVVDSRTHVNFVRRYSFIGAIEEAKAIDKLLDTEELDDAYSETNKPFLGVPFTAKEAMAITGCLFYYSTHV